MPTAYKTRHKCCNSWLKTCWQLNKDSLLKLTKKDASPRGIAYSADGNFNQELKQLPQFLKSLCYISMHFNMRQVQR